MDHTERERGGHPRGGDLQARLEASEARFRNVVERSSDGVLMVDASGHVLYANSGVAAMLGRDRAALVGAEIGFPVVTGDVIEVELIRPGGLVSFAEMRVVDSEWEGRPCRLALLRDVTERHRTEAQLADLATHDHLTHLANRYLLEDRLAQALARMDRGGGPLAVFLVDLDDFKAVNDTYGHIAGDEILTESARRISTMLRPTDTAARFGGDEFVVLCESMGPDVADQFVDRLTAALARPMAWAGRQVAISVSIGYAVAVDASSSAASLLATADHAMYRRKRSRRAPARRLDG